MTVELRPAATLVLLRPLPAPGDHGFEVLLTRRPDSMRFGPGKWVFPGGRLEAGEAWPAAAVRETAEETGIEVAAGDLVSMTRWVTPFGLPARYDARFFAAIVGPAIEVARASDEVAEWAWLRPALALEAMAAGRLSMWQPTVVTLQQLEPIPGAEALADAFGPTVNRAAPDDPPSIPGLPADADHTVPSAWQGGIEGRRGWTQVVGRHDWVIVDPGDPTGEAFGAILEAAADSGARLAGVVIRALAPERHAGVELFARGLGLPVAGPPGADAILPYDVVELANSAAVPFGDVPLEAEVVTPPVPGPAAARWSDRAGRLELRAGPAALQRG